MDFASGELDDVDVVPPAQIGTAITGIQEGLEDLARSFRGGALLRSGVSLALVGRPNAGKSSLFNRLLERPRAIVTPVPGTTRDTVEEAWSLAGIPVRLVDTAGLRLAGEKPADEAERQGIERSREALADADLVLLVHDATVPLTAEEQGLARQLEGRPHLLVRNKIDLDTSAGNAIPSGTGTAEPEMLAVSALTGAGFHELRAAILRRVQAEGGMAETGALNNRRQHEAVLRAMAALEAATAANHSGLPHEILLLDLHTASARWTRSPAKPQPTTSSPASSPPSASANNDASEPCQGHPVSIEYSSKHRALSFHCCPRQSDPILHDSCPRRCTLPPVYRIFSCWWTRSRVECR